MLKAQQQQAQADQLTALQEKLKGDTSSIMSRYGALIAMKGGLAGSPRTAGA
jgi:hypothetical protein